MGESPNASSSDGVAEGLAAAESSEGADLRREQGCRVMRFSLESTLLMTHRDTLGRFPRCDT